MYDFLSKVEPGFVNEVVLENADYVSMYLSFPLYPNTFS